MSIRSYEWAAEAAVLNAEVCLDKQDFKEFLHNMQDSIKRRLEVLEVDNGLGFLKFFDEE